MQNISTGGNHDNVAYAGPGKLHPRSRCGHGGTSCWAEAGPAFKVTLKCMHACMHACMQIQPALCILPCIHIYICM